MIRRIVPFAATLALLLPKTGLAYDTAADLLKGIEYKGQPQNISVEAHGNAEGTHMSLWLEGIMEGKEAHDLKADIKATLDIAEAGQTVRTKNQIIVTNGTLYYRLQELTPAAASLMVPEINNFLGKWTHMPLPADEMAGMDTTDLGAEFEAIGQQMINAALTFDRKHFVGGYAHKMNLKPDFITHIRAALVENGLLTTDEDMSFFGTTDIAMIQDEINKALQLSLKVDTNDAGKMQFARAWMHFDMEDVTVDAQLEMEPRSAPVNVTAPSGSVLMEGVMPFGNHYLPGWPSWIDPAEWMVGEQFEVIEWPSMPGMMPEGEESTFEVPAGCDAESGTPEYTLQIRKGQCPVPANSRPGRGTLR